MSVPIKRLSNLKYLAIAWSLFSIFGFTAGSISHTTCMAISELSNEVDTSLVYVIVENMPVFKGCEEIKDTAKRDLCTKEKIRAFIAENQYYPELARMAGTQGTVYISFIVDRKGEVVNVEVLKGVTGGKILDYEAVHLISSLPQFIPGTHKGSAVKVIYTTKVKFELTK